MTRFGQDIGVAILSYRSRALWLLGYPRAALADAGTAVRNARNIGQAPTLMYALFHTSLTSTCCGNHTAALAEADELIALAAEKGSALWKALGMTNQGWLFALTGNTRKAVSTITSGIAASHSTGTTLFIPSWLSLLAKAHADLGQFDDAWRCIEKSIMAVETTGERWCEAEVNRVAGEIALLSTEPEKAKAEEYFNRALEVARKQQAKSWELRAAMSMARLWRDQGKRDEARELLAPVYGWFTEGFDTLDLKEAKALLDELA